MNDDDLKRQRAIAAAATPGPWSFDGDRRKNHEHLSSPTESHVLFAAPCGYENSHLVVSDADAAFIAAARSDWPRCLDEIERLQDEEEASSARAMYAEAEIERLRAAIFELAAQHTYGTQGLFHALVNMVGNDGVAQWQAWREKAGRG